MQTNREWLFSLPLDELYEWFDAPHANDGFNAEKVVTHCDVRSNDANVDSREKLNAFRAQFGAGPTFMTDEQIEAMSEHYRPKREADMVIVDEIHDEPDSREKLEAEVRFIASVNEDNEKGIELFENMVLDLLDRQAAITERGHAVDNLAIEELRRQRDYWKLHTDCWAEKCNEAESELAELRAKVKELTADLKDEGRAVNELGDENLALKAENALLLDANARLQASVAKQAEAIGEYELRTEELEEENDALREWKSVAETFKAERDEWRKRAMQHDSKGDAQKLNSLRNTLSHYWHVTTKWDDSRSVYDLLVDPDVLHPIPGFTRNEIYRNSMLERDGVIGQVTSERNELADELLTATRERERWRAECGRLKDLAHEMFNGEIE